MDVKNVLFILIIIILFWYFSKSSKSEHFDTFYDHDQQAYYVYAEQYPEIDMETTILKDKYQWAQRDKAGLTIYDKVYEKQLTDDHDKYNVQSAYKFDDFTGMYSPQPSANFGGYEITLMQKSY